MSHIVYTHFSFSFTASDHSWVQASYFKRIYRFVMCQAFTRLLSKLFSLRFSTSSWRFLLNVLSAQWTTCTMLCDVNLLSGIHIRSMIYLPLYCTFSLLLPYCWTYKAQCLASFLFSVQTIIFNVLNQMLLGVAAKVEFI